MFDASALVTKKATKGAVPLRPVNPGNWDRKLSKEQVSWAGLHGFKGEAGSCILLPNSDGAIALIGVDGDDWTPWSLAPAALALPPGAYKLEGAKKDQAAKAALGWCLAQYRFERFRSEKTAEVRSLALPAGTDVTATMQAVDATVLARDLVNTPTEFMGPGDLQDATEALAEEFGATCKTVVGDDLLDENFPAIHAVGRAAALGREPRLIDLCWGDKDAPKVTLVGKGVCFDTGGLDLKSAAGMLLMKKDMGGAAHVLALARLIMASNLPVRLRLLVSAVENAVDGNAFRPGDILDTRKGLSVEVGNTDAEGRLVLCDALALACEEEPSLLIDFATLTGAARVALGPDLPAAYTNDDSLWTAIEAAATAEHDPLWRMPLWAPYDASLASDIADVSNIAAGAFGGSITAALYLQRFVEPNIPWVHFDVFAWVPKATPGRPKGGDIQAVRTMFAAVNDFLSLDA